METLVDLLQEKLQSSPEKVIYRHWENGSIVDEMSFATLARRAQAVAAALMAVAPPGERVILAFPQSLHPITAFFACHHAAMVAVPIILPPLNRVEVLKRFITDAQSHTVLTLSAIASALKPEAEAAGLSDLHWIALDEVDPAQAETWKKPALGADSPALMLYTSGSTNFPRGIIASQGNLVASIRITSEPMNHLHNVQAIAWTPLQNAMGLLMSLNVLGYDTTQMWFATQVFIQKPITWLRLISEYHANLSIGATFAYRMCVEAVKPEERQGLDLGSWNIAVCGGEPVRLEVLQKFVAAYEPYGFSYKAFSTAYGMSEIGGCSQSAIGVGPRVVWAAGAALEQRKLEQVPPETPGARSFVSCGKPFSANHVLIVDPETLQECPPDTIGEIWVASPTVAQGYWNKPQETEQTFHARTAEGKGPFLRTGDLGFLQAGELFISGRLKDVIIVHGRNLSAVDFEAIAAGAHPALMPGSAAAFGILEDGEEKVVLMHETRPGQEDVNVEEVAAQIRLAVSQRLNVPLHAVVLVKPGSLPRTPTGKVQRYLCRARYLESQAGQKS